MDRRLYRSTTSSAVLRGRKVPVRAASASITAVAAMNTVTSGMFFIIFWVVLDSSDLQHTDSGFASATSPHPCLHVLFGSMEEKIYKPRKSTNIRARCW